MDYSSHLSLMVATWVIYGLETNDLGDKTSLLTARTGNWRGAKKVKFEEG